MSLASTWLDLVVGVDLHFHVIPMAGTAPIPQIFLGLVGDPVGRIAGALTSAGIELMQGGRPQLTVGIVLIHSLPATTTADRAKNALLLKHLPTPPGVAHVKPPEGDATLPIGVLPVTFGSENAIVMGTPALSCGNPTRMPTSSTIVIPKGPPVLVKGPLGVNVGRAVANWALGKVVRTTFGVASKLARYAARLSATRLRNLISKAKCFLTGHPVDVATGRVITEATDFALPGPLPLVFERNYASSWSARDGVLGPGWSHSLDQAVWSERNKLVYRNAEGQEIVFDLSETKGKAEVGRDMFEPINRNTMTRTRAGWRLVTAEGLVHHFARIEGEIDPRPGLARLVRITRRNKAIAISCGYDQRGRLSTVKDSTGREVKLEHDDQGRLSHVLLPDPGRPNEWVRHISYAYSEEGLLIEARDALGNATKYEYDGRLMVRETDRNGLSFYWRYDGRGAGARCVRTWGDGGIYNQIIDYNPDARITVVTNSYDRKTTYRMNAVGAVVEIIDPINGRLVREYDDELQVVAETDGNGTTRFVYGPRGVLSSVTFAERSQLITKYDPRFPELATLERDEEGAVWRHLYDGGGQLLETRGPAREVWRRYEWEGGLLKAVVDPAGRTEVVERDAWGTPTVFRLPNRAEVRRECDRRGRLVAITNPYGRHREYVYDLLDRVVEVREEGVTLQRTSYDPESNVLEEEDTLGRVRCTYAGFNKLASREEAGLDGKPGDVVKLQWGFEGELRELRNEQGHDYQFFYDPCLRLEREIGFDVQETRYERDAAGQVVKVEKPKARFHTEIERDKRGRITGVKHSDGTFARFGYRRNGFLIEATNHTTTVKFERDAVGRIVREQQGEHVVTSTYAGGYRVALESTLGAALALARDALGNPTKIGIGGWEALHTPAITLDYDVGGLETRRSLPGGVVAEWRRDRLGRPERHELRGGAGPAWTQDYAWTLDDRITAIDDTRFGRATYEHDFRGRLFAERRGEAVQFRALDRWGNVYRTPDRSDRRYVRGGLIRHDRDTTFHFDNLGNLTAKVEPGERTWRYNWDGAGMLTEVERPGGRSKVTFAYDALGRRVSKKVGDVETRWVWDEDVILHEFKPGARVTTWYHEPESFAPLARVEDGHVQAVVTDHLGTPTAMYDGAGRLAWQMQLDLFGVPMESADLRTREVCPFRWPGQYDDPETGLYYNRYRYYEPRLGTYVSQDPLGIEGGLSAFAYPSDPLVGFDPLGLLPVYHYTDQAGYRAILSGRGRGKGMWWFRSSQPRAKHHPPGVYLTADDAATVRRRGIGKYRIPHEKFQYYFKMEIPDDQLRKVPGGRGQYILYTPHDLDIAPAQQLGRGCT